MVMKMLATMKVGPCTPIDKTNGTPFLGLFVALTCHVFLSSFLFLFFSSLFFSFSFLLLSHKLSHEAKRPSRGPGTGNSFSNWPTPLSKVSRCGERQWRRSYDHTGSLYCCHHLASDSAWDVGRRRTRTASLQGRHFSLARYLFWSLTKDDHCFIESNAATSPSLLSLFCNLPLS